jgi:hypothetical protein
MRVCLRTASLQRPALSRLVYTSHQRDIADVAWRGGSVDLDPTSGLEFRGTLMVLAFDFLPLHTYDSTLLILNDFLTFSISIVFNSIIQGQR